MRTLPNDITIEEIGQLIKSCDPVDMEELVTTWLDDETKAKLKALL